MSVAAMKKLWPFSVTPKVRNWVNDHIAGGTIERMAIATNAPLSTLRTSGPRIPDDGLSIEITGNGAEVRPVEGLPAIRDADLTLRVVGRKAVVSLGRGNVEMSGRKLVLTNGVFEVPDTFPTAPPAKARFRVDGPVAAAAELLALERLRDFFSGSPLDPATSRGTLSAQVTVGLPLKEDLPPARRSTRSTWTSRISPRATGDGPKVEAASLHVAANIRATGSRAMSSSTALPPRSTIASPR